jgi:hypothetical protein
MNFWRIWDCEQRNPARNAGSSLDVNSVLRSESSLCKSLKDANVTRDIRKGDRKIVKILWIRFLALETADI